jgi:CheY-like chemotaxis protein
LFLTPALPLVTADRGQLEQIILNLAVNARDAMPQGGQLTLETDNVYLDETYADKRAELKPGPYVVLAVSDTGHGIDPDTQQHMFDPFFTTRERDQGTGLGLSMVHGIVKQHNGHIWVYSEPGRGTTFKIYLPQAAKPARLIDPVVVEPADLNGGETVLVVEDDAEVRALVANALTAHGYAVLSASTPEAGLELAKKHTTSIQLLLTDVIMPGMNGPQLFQHIGRLQPQIKVLYISGYTDNVIAHHGVLDEGIDYLQKPFTIRGLTHKVRQVLSFQIGAGHK